MSTKATIAHGPDFHLYREVFEDGKVYLAIEGADFTARPGGITVAIPARIWEVIRRHPAPPEDESYGPDAGEEGLKPTSPPKPC